MDYELSPAARLVFLALRSGGPASVVQLSASIRRSLPVVRGGLKELQRLGLVAPPAFWHLTPRALDASPLSAQPAP
jgi:hypothetical protein